MVKVLIHNKFMTGHHNSDAFMDIPAILNNPNHALPLLSFIASVEKGEPLPGRNKRSYVDTYGMEISKAQKYKQYGIWHYHIGPHDPSLPCPTESIYHENLFDYTSGSVVHYTWAKEAISPSIVLLAYSPTHEAGKFPDFNSKSAPFRSRVEEKGEYKGAQSLFPPEQDE